MWDAETYGENWADIYDNHVSTRQPALDPTSAVKFLGELANRGRVLELGVGTGRLALPLAEMGLQVDGIEASEKMIGRLKAKSLSDRVSVILGDYSRFELSARYPLVYAAYNGILMLPDRDDQINCFKDVARVLKPGGRFVIEAQVPDFNGFMNRGKIELNRMDYDCVEVRITEHRRNAQQFFAQHIWLEDGGIKMKPMTIRYAWPSELDLMANLAGLFLENRYGGWEKQRFDDRSIYHVSVYTKSDGS